MTMCFQRLRRMRGRLIFDNVSAGMSAGFDLVDLLPELLPFMILSFCPGLSLRGSEIPLALAMELVVVLCFFAIPLRVSPGRTV